MESLDNSILRVAQYAQEDTVDSAEALEDILTSSTKNNQLDSLQIANIGIGLLGDSPFSSTSGKTNTNIGFDRINQSLRCIIRTVLEEVPMLPILGSNISNLIFEPIDEILEDTLEISLRERLSLLEPRIKIRDIVISKDNRDENEIGVYIEYQLTNTNIVGVFRDSIVTGNGGDII